MTINARKEFLEIGGFKRGPIHWRQPHRIVRRTIRGMLPYRKAKGIKAFKRLKVHIGIPDEFKNSEIENMPEIHSRNLGQKYISIGEIAENIGWKKYQG
jgi:large subunit ribosomal protein L13